MKIEPFSIILVTILLITAAITDIRKQKIPNLLTGPAILVALSYHTYTHGMAGLIFSIEGLSIGIVVLILPYIRGGMGAGDAKLMGAVGAILGPKSVFIAFLATALVGGIYALILFIIHYQTGKGFIARHLLTLKTFLLTHQLILIPADKNEKQPKLCYGVAIAGGTLIYVILELTGYRFII